MNDTMKMEAPTYSPQSALRDPSWAGWVHVASLVCAVLTSWMVGFGGMLPAFLVWLTQSDKQSLTARHAAECFNFNLSLFLYSIGIVVIGVLFSIVTLGIGLILAVPVAIVLALGMALAWIVCSVLAAKAGFEGQEYVYPFTIRVLK